jgi:hypothetical protein
MNHTITIDVSELTSDVTIKLRGGTPGPAAPAMAEPAPDPRQVAVVGVLNRLRAYGNRAAVDALFEGLRSLHLTPEIARSRQPTPPAYLRWLRDEAIVLSGNTARIDVARRTLDAYPGLRKELLALPGAEPRGATVIVPVATVAQVEAVLAVLRQHLGKS